MYRYGNCGPASKLDEAMCHALLYWNTHWMGIPARYSLQNKAYKIKRSKNRCFLQILCTFFRLRTCAGSTGKGSSSSSTQYGLIRLHCSSLHLFTSLWDSRSLPLSSLTCFSPFFPSVSHSFISGKVSPLLYFIDSRHSALDTRRVNLDTRRVNLCAHAPK